MSSFALPNFNLDCNVWHNASSRPIDYPAPDYSVKCNLANGRISHVLNTDQRKDPQRTIGCRSSALFPKDTDLRDAACGRRPDVVEIPAGTGRYYWVTYVDDIAKGFVNEHRWAVLQKVFVDGWYLGTWPTPIP